MKFRNLNKWSDPLTLASLVYFAQILDEMLFDYSLDTYKPSIMNSYSLCHEAIQTIKEVENGNINSANIKHVINELVANLQKDLVAQKLLSVSINALIPTLKNPKTTNKELLVTVEIIMVQLSSKKYKLSNEQLITECINGEIDIKSLRSLSRSYITQLMSIGFSQKYIQGCVLDFFFYGENKIENLNVIEDFFELFIQQKRKFKVYFNVGRNFLFLDGDSPLVKIINQQPNIIDGGKHDVFFNSFDKKTFAYLDEIEAYDFYSAKAHAENKLKLAATLIGLFHHKSDVFWSNDALVIDDLGHAKKIGKALNPMHKCKDLKEAAANTRLKSFISEFSLGRESFAKFIRSAQLHSMALMSNTTENQILNLWISLESLIPSETKNADSANIQHISDSIIPFLNSVYVEKLLNNLIKDILRWNKHEFFKLLKKAPAGKFSVRLAQLMILDEHRDILNEFKTKFKDYHLLKDRFDYIQYILSSPKKVLDTLENHKTRVEWQIRRIYRTRNIIVHSGHTPGYTPFLIEHAHDFLDIILDRLVKLSTTPRSITSVAQAFKLVEIKYGIYISSLEAKNLAFDKENIQSLLFG